MHTKTRRKATQLIRATAWLAGCAVLLMAIFATPVHAETKTVVAQGSTDVCFSTREIALNLARTGASNDAHDECRALGDGWSFTGNKFPGYEQCTSCGSNGFKCKVTQAVYICTNMQKERAEKAAKERAEKEARDKEAKDKADRVKAERELQRKLAKEKSDREHAEKVAKAKVAKEKANREKLERETRQKADKLQAEKEAKVLTDHAKEKKRPPVENNSIDDAFSKMEKQTGKSPTGKTENIDTEFEKMEAYRVEKERLRLIALKARQEREARELAQKEKHDEATQFCKEAIKAENSCFVSACKSEPSKTKCTDSRRDESTSTCPKGQRCLVFPTYTCYSTGSNPAYAEWESCTRNMESKCTKNGARLPNIEECTRQRERPGNGR